MRKGGKLQEKGIKILSKQDKHRNQHMYLGRIRPNSLHRENETQ